MFYIFNTLYRSDDFKIIASFQEVDFDDFSQNDLVVFDVDETLIQPIDGYLINEHSTQIKLKLFQTKMLVQYPIFLKDNNERASIMMQEAQRPLIEPEIVDIIQRLQSRDVPVIACTFMNTGSFGKIRSMEQWRFEHLRSLGINLSKSFGIKKLAIQGTKRNPQYYKGILCTDLTSKGDVLGSFLDQVNFKPKKIIFFDDNYEYLVQLQELCKKRNILFIGYHYQGAKTKLFNEPIAWIQAQYLAKHRKWLSDDEVVSLQSSF